MTAVTFSPRGIGDQSDTEPIFTGGFYKIRLSATQTSGQWVLPAWSTPRQLTGAVVTENLDPNPTIPYELLMYVPNGGSTVGKLGGMLEVHEFRMVTGSGPVAWESLPLSTGPTGEAAPTNTQALINADLYAQIAGFAGGGATNLAGITNMSTDGRTLLLTPNSFSTMRGLLGAAPTSHTHVATTDLTATGTKNTTTFLRGDNTWAAPPAAGSPAWTDITGKPSTFPPTLPITQSDVTGLAAALTAANSAASAATAAAAAATAAATALQTTVDDQATLITSLASRVQELEENGANMAAIVGAAAARNNPLTGTGLNTGSVVTWLVDGTAPTNAVTGDIVLNRVSV